MTGRVCDYAVTCARGLYDVPCTAIYYRAIYFEKEFQEAEMNIKQTLEDTASRIPDKEAIVLGAQRVTYRELDEASNKVANALLGLGMKKGAHVTMLMSHSTEWVINYFGVIKAGGIAVLPSTALKAPELESLLRDSDSEILITEKKFSQMLCSVLPAISQLRHVIEIDGDLYKRMVSESSVASPEVGVDDNDEVTIIYTSGVLGRQKGVVHTHTSLMGPLKILSEGIELSKGDVVIDPVPFFYLLGLGEVLLDSIMEGATIVIVPQFTPRTVLETVEKERGSILFGVPAMFNALAMLRDEVVKSYDISSLRVASSAGAKTFAPLMKALEDKLCVTFCERYGLSELFVVSMSTVHDHKLGTVGRPICGLKIVDDSGNEVLRGEIGEAVFNVPWMMKGYYKAPELTAQVLKDGWFYTGDLVRMDEEGYLEYVEKKSFIIVTSSGLKISPSEVEFVLVSHPSVAEAAYVGINDGYTGQIPTAFVVLKEGHHATAQDLFNLCYQKLADFKLPKRIEFVDSLPKTASGKIFRKKLRERGLSQS